MNGTLRVGLLGAGPVAESIHLPTLARLTDLFHIANVMDVDPGVADSVAAQSLLPHMVRRKQR